MISGTLYKLDTVPYLKLAMRGMISGTLYKLDTVPYLLLCAISCAGCVRWIYEDRAVGDGQSASDSYFPTTGRDATGISSEAGTRTETRPSVVTDMGIALPNGYEDQINKTPVVAVLNKNNQNCTNPGEIDGAALPDYLTNTSLKVRLDPAGATRSSAACIENLAPFILRVRNAPMTIFCTCNFSGELRFRSTATTCTTTSNQMSVTTCLETNSNGAGGENMVAKTTNYLIICRDPNLGPAILNFTQLIL